MHPNHMSDYIYVYCVYVNKCIGKVCFYEITTHFHLKVYFYPNANYSLLYLLDACILTYIRQRMMSSFAN